MQTATRSQGRRAGERDDRDDVSPSFDEVSNAALGFNNPELDIKDCVWKFLPACRHDGGAEANACLCICVSMYNMCVYIYI